MIPAFAQDETAMPLEVHERLWENPGPAQDGAGAPKLLIVYPSARGDDGSGGGGAFGGGGSRYAGRVEPDTAQVQLNGEVLKVWPGGTFTGTKTLRPGETQTWKFVAESEQKTTTVERTVRRGAVRTPPPPAPRRPLAFYASPVSPSGDYWLPKDKPLAVTLYASADAIAEYRVGSKGEWQAMIMGGADARRGGQYTASILAPAASDSGATTPTLMTVEFRVKATESSSDAPVSMTSELRLARVPDQPPLARVTKNLGTFLKDVDGWDRFGNWIARTPFPVLEAHDARIRTDFGNGQTGWVEMENAKIDWSAKFGDLAKLSDPVVIEDRNRLVMRWPSRAAPTAVVFDHTPGDSGDKVKIAFSGVSEMPEKDFDSSAEKNARSLAVHAAGAQSPPVIDAVLKGPLWGFGIRANPFQIDLRTQPKLDKATADKPLAGFKIMIDAGHGGRDSGAIGPSGVTEADLNLVEAAWLEKKLMEMGATTKQIRRDDRTVELDDRVDMAIAWDPDLFISLHHNAVGGGAGPLTDSGPIVFYHYTASQPFAKFLSERMVKQWPDAKARARPEVFRVNRNVSLCPSVLIELGFVTNPEDEYKLRQIATIKENAKLIAEGVRDYLKQ